MLTNFFQQSDDVKLKLFKSFYLETKKNPETFDNDVAVFLITQRLDAEFIEKLAREDFDKTEEIADKIEEARNSMPKEARNSMPKLESNPFTDKDYDIENDFGIFDFDVKEDDFHQSKKARFIEIKDEDVTSDLVTKLIRYQFTQVAKEQDSLKKAQKIGTLKNLLSKNHALVEELQFGFEEEDASVFLDALLRELYKESPLVTKIIKIPTDENSAIAPENTFHSDDFILHLNLEKQPNEEVVMFKDSLFADLCAEEIREAEFEDDQKVEAKVSSVIYVKDGVDEFVISPRRYFMEHDKTGSTIGEGKITNPIIFDDLKLPVINKGNVDENNKTVFEVTSFIVHDGNSLKLPGQHYLCYAKEEDGNWYLHNDDKKTLVENQQDLEKAKEKAYLVKYSAVNNPNLLSKPTQGAVNLGNTCWAGAAAVFAGSLRSFDCYQDIELSDKEMNVLEHFSYKIPELNLRMIHSLQSSQFDDTPYKPITQPQYETNGENPEVTKWYEERGKEAFDAKQHLRKICNYLGEKFLNGDCDEIDKFLKYKTTEEKKEIFNMMCGEDDKCGIVDYFIENQYVNSDDIEEGFMHSVSRGAQDLMRLFIMNDYVGNRAITRAIDESIQEGNEGIVISILEIQNEKLRYNTIPATFTKANNEPAATLLGKRGNDGRDG